MRMAPRRRKRTARRKRKRTDYKTPKWGNVFEHYAERGGKGAFKNLTRAQYNAYTVCKIRNCRRRALKTGNRIHVRPERERTYYSKASEKAAYDRVLERLQNSRQNIPLTSSEDQKKHLVRELLLETARSSEELRREPVRKRKTRVITDESTGRKKTIILLARPPSSPKFFTSCAVTIHNIGPDIASTTQNPTQQCHGGS